VVLHALATLIMTETASIARLSLAYWVRLLMTGQSIAMAEEQLRAMLDLALAYVTPCLYQTLMILVGMGQIANQI